MKVFKRVGAVLLAVILVFNIVACGNNTPEDKTNKLTPNDIKSLILPKLIDYSTASSYYTATKIIYEENEEFRTERDNLAAKILEKKGEFDRDEVTSSIVKIFANANAERIIDAMSDAGLGQAKMIKAVHYLAGDPDVVPDIDARMEALKNSDQAITATTGWSFSDDWEFYERLQDLADETNKVSHENNVKRQYRNITGKVFAIGMAGNEFARVMISEMTYCIEVTEDMSGETFKQTPYKEYMFDHLDYDTYVTFLTFDDFYANYGRAMTVQLYGYHYDYNKKIYDSTNDETFEKELKYGNMTTFTDEEWLDYVKIQRDLYINAYRYSEDFYVVYANLHFSYQKVQESYEKNLFEIDLDNTYSYTEEMKKSVQNNGINGQLSLMDWMWCYSADNAVMKAYNKANTSNEKGKEQGENTNAYYVGAFDIQMQQLLIAKYLLANMKSTELGNALKFQIFNYSAEMIKNIHYNKKDQFQIKHDKLDVDEIAAASHGLEKVKEYEIGKIGVINQQISNTLSDFGVTNKANKAAEQGWSTMLSEVQTAIEFKYDELKTAKEKKERMDDLVLKKVYSCGTEIDDPNCRNQNGHTECTKEYSKSHAISQFALNYEVVMRYVGGQASIQFMVPSSTTQYTLTGEAEAINYVPGFYERTLTDNMVRKPGSSETRAFLDYVEHAKLTVSSGKDLVEAIKTSETKNWWTNAATSKPPKTSATVEETLPNTNKISYVYAYTFTAWYYDQDLKYKLEESDIIKTDMIFYAGYTVKKTKA